MKIKYVAVILLVISISCSRGQGKAVRQPVPGKSEMADLNRYFVRKDRERIANYIDRKNLKMTESSSGLWYMIKTEGSGSYLTDRDKITMEYECSLLDGTICYSSIDLGPKEIIIGKTTMESGLNQGLRMLKPGGEAVFILPPFLAYGITGDGGKIPPRAVIIYHIKISGNP
ncbi:MAG: FKBP-type peptidyl-prolyl cis-trans isomerase [Bacteroidales bacterium]|jgi:FKBP-type peptidyl-prolyl cis-trans isomerase